MSQNLYLAFELSSCCMTLTKRERRNKRVLPGCQTHHEVPSEVLIAIQQWLGKYNHISTTPLTLYTLWRCFAVTVFVMSLWAFYDCTWIVDALFYTESYFRIQYVLLYIKCIVWRKLNKRCWKLKTIAILCDLFCTWCFTLWRWFEWENIVNPIVLGSDSAYF